MGIAFCLEKEESMKPIKKINAIAFFLLVAGIMVLIAKVSVTEHINSADLETKSVVVEPVRVEAIDQATDRYYFSVENIEETNNTLLFYTNHQEVEVHVGEKLIYSLEKEESIFGRTPGAMWNILSLPVGTTEFSVLTRQAYPTLEKQEIVFELGNAIPMQREVVIGSIIDVCICLSILLIGGALLLYWLLVFRKVNTQKDILYLGLFALIFGQWAFGETKLAVFMFSNRAFWSYMAFTCLMTMCLPFLYFVKEFLQTEDKHLHKLIAGYIVIETIVAQFLHLTNIASVKETVMFTIANIVFTMLYLLYGIVMAVKKGKSKRRIFANVLGLLALMITAIVDTSGYFTNVSDSNQLGKLGFLIYAIILGVETARAAQEQVQEAHKMEIYREMAMKDMPTGCYNRNAYSQDTSLGVELTGVQVITFDLNNLKVCNDTKGHMAGDKYIADAANMIQDVFKGLGKVYRIGGDEFCILAKGINEGIIVERRRILRDAIRTYRSKNADEGFGIACGYAMYDPVIDKDIEETRHRADLSMYVNKKEIKALS